MRAAITTEAAYVAVVGSRQRFGGDGYGQPMNPGPMRKGDRK